MKPIRFVATTLAVMAVPLALMSAATAQPAIPGFIGKVELGVKSMATKGPAPCATSAKCDCSR